VNYCPTCGAKLEDEGGKCAQCEPADSKSTNNDVVTPADHGNQPKLFSEVVSARDLAKKAEREAEKGQKRREKYEQIKNSLSSAWQHFLQLRKWTFPLAALVLLGMTWGVGQFVIYSVNGPDGVLQRYVDAVNSDDWGALSDNSLFANGASAAAAGDTTKASRNSASSVTLVHVERDGSDAQAALTIGGLTYDIHVKAQMEFSGLFWFPKWSITTPAPTLTVTFDPIFDPRQIVLVGGEEIVVSEAETMLGARVVVLPGSYTYVVKAAGFMADSSAIPIVVKDAVTVRVDNGGLDLSAAAASAVDKKISSAAKSCFKKKCKALGTWRDTDFSFWSRWPYDKYTNYRFSWRGSFDSCNRANYELISPTKIVANATCTGDIKAKMYIRWVYYYGWYSDYWYYANYTDSRSTSVNTSVEITTSLDGSKISVGKVNIVG
jgi:hypothetical protein